MNRAIKSPAPLVAVVSQSFAHDYFHGRDPVGLHIKVGDRYDSPMPAMTVIGIVGDIKQAAVDQPTVNQMYEPIAQAAADLGPMANMLGVAGSMDLVVSTAQDPTLLAADAERIIHQMDPLLAVPAAHTHWKR